MVFRLRPPKPARAPFYGLLPTPLRLLHPPHRRFKSRLSFLARSLAHSPVAPFPIPTLLLPPQRKVGWMCVLTTPQNEEEGRGTEGEWRGRDVEESTIYAKAAFPVPPPAMPARLVLVRVLQLNSPASLPPESRPSLILYKPSASPSSRV